MELFLGGGVEALRLPEVVLVHGVVLVVVVEGDPEAVGATAAAVEFNFVPDGPHLDPAVCVQGEVAAHVESEILLVNKKVPSVKLSLARSHCGGVNIFLLN